MGQRENLEDRINYLEKEVERIKKMYEKTIAYEETDPEVSLQQARKAAEAICKNLYINEVNSNPGKLMLDELIRKLIENKVIPQKIVVPLRTIQGYGNLAAHDNGDDPDSITSEYIQPCIGSLSTLVSWYFEEYCSADNISEKLQHRPSSNAEKDNLNSKIKDFELNLKSSNGSSALKKSGINYKYAVIGLAVLLAAFIGIKSLINKDNGVKNEAPKTAVQSNQTASNNSTNNVNSQQQDTAKPVKTGTETAVNKYVEKYNGKIKFGVTTVNVDGDNIYVNFYVDNKSSNDVSVATYKNVYLLDASGNQFEAKPFESQDFSKVASGAKVSGKISFEASGVKDPSTLTLKASYWIMDPKAGDTKIVIPFK